MIVLDTNVLSEPLRPAPSDSVMRWLAAQEPSTIYTTTVTQAELLYGVELLAPGRRRARLLTALARIFVEEFTGRILPFDEDAAREFARIVAARKTGGHPISQFDGMIAAIARSHGASLATRNAPHFKNCGVAVVNPWTD